MAKNNTSQEKPEGVEPVGPVQTSRPNRTWRLGSLFWGLLLVLIGTLLILDNLNVVDVHFGNVLRLWPLAIVAIGVSVLSLRGAAAKLITVVLMIVTFGLIALAATDNLGRATSVSTKAVLVEQEANVESAEINIKAGASKIRLDTHDDTAITDATLISGSTDLRHASELDGTTQHVDLEMHGPTRWWFGDGRNDLNVDLTRELPLAVAIDAGASSIDVNLSQAQLDSLSIDSGASSIDITLGERHDEQRVTVKAGASSVNIRVPNGVGVRAEIDGGLTGKTMADLRDIGNDTFESEGFNEAVKKIYITADLGLASFELIRY